VGVAFHSTELRFERHQGGRTPALLLIARAPARDPPPACLDPRHHGFEQIGGLEARPELGEHAEPIQREGFVESVGQTRRGGRVTSRSSRWTRRSAA
jgi:hypothetical protein